MSMALNNIVGLNLETKYSPTAVTKDIMALDELKNGVTVHVIDTPGLGSVSFNTDEIVAEMSAVAKSFNFILLF